MAVERFEISSEGAKALLLSDEVRADIRRRAEQIARHHSEVDFKIVGG